MELWKTDPEVWLAGEPLAGRTGHDVGRILLERLYAELTGEKIPEIAVAEGGKPYFPGSPWHFSITHTPRHAFCALAKTPVGMDAEELDRAVNLRLAEKVLSPGEKAQFDRAEDKNRAFLTFWVLKEASVKRTGKGLRGYPNDTDFSLDDPAVAERDGCLVAVLFHNEQ